MTKRVIAVGTSIITSQGRRYSRWHSRFQVQRGSRRHLLLAEAKYCQLRCDALAC